MSPVVRCRYGHLESRGAGTGHLRPQGCGDTLGTDLPHPASGASHPVSPRDHHPRHSIHPQMLRPPTNPSTVCGRKHYWVSLEIILRHDVTMDKRGSPPAAGHALSLTSTIRRGIGSHSHPTQGLLGTPRGKEGPAHGRRETLVAQERSRCRGRGRVTCGHGPLKPGGSPHGSPGSEGLE